MSHIFVEINANKEFNFCKVKYPYATMAVQCVADTMGRYYIPVRRTQAGQSTRRSRVMTLPGFYHEWKAG